LVTKLSQRIAHVAHLLLHNFFEERSQFLESSVSHIIKPTFNEDSIVWLQLEVLSHIVHNYGPGEIPAYPTEVFDKNWAVRDRMLPVQPGCYVFILVHLVQHPVRIILHGSCEDHNLVELTHLLKEDVDARPHKKVAFISYFEVMD